MSKRLYGSSPATASQMVLEMGNRVGGNFIADTAAYTGKWGAITALAAAVATLTTAQDGIWDSGTSTSVPIPAGTTIYGNFTGITLASGKVIAYFAP